MSRLERIRTRLGSLRGSITRPSVAGIRTSIREGTHNLRDGIRERIKKKKEGSNSMGFFVVLRAIFVRLMFVIHGTVAIWRLYLVTKVDYYWYLMIALGILFFESFITLCGKRRKEWKWFCPCVFLYLCSVVPSIWFIELHQLQVRLTDLANNGTVTPVGVRNETASDLRASIKGIGEIYIPISLSSTQWILVIEQGLLLILIIGRWLLPKGKLTHDQLSQLLLVYIGTAADIVEFFEAMKEDVVRHNQILTFVVLGIWSWSLLQFCMVITATKSRGDQSGVLQRNYSQENDETDCCTADVYGILISIVMQDAPFLALRLTLILHFNVLSYTNLFFTAKNALVILLLTYRLICVQIEVRRSRKKKRKEVALQEEYGDVKIKSLNLNLDDYAAAKELIQKKKSSPNCVTSESSVEVSPFWQENQEPSPLFYRKCDGSNGV